MFHTVSPGFGSPVRYASQALDAADGVIDGKYFGHPIVQGTNAFSGSAFSGTFTSAPMSTPYRSSAAAALALDAADGVMDGKYFGHQIAEVPSMMATTSYVPSTTYLTSPVTHFAPAPVYAPAPAPSIFTAPAPVYTPSVVLPPTDMTVITNVPPLGTTSVSVVDCHGMPGQQVHQPVQHHVHTQETTTYIQKQIPGAAAFAEEFRDLRSMLDRDRASFEQMRLEFERTMAERESRLKMDQEKLAAEWAKFRSESKVTQKTSSITTSHEIIKVKTLKDGQDLDVKDGIIDGKFNGKQIVVDGVGPLVPPPHLMGKRVGPAAGAAGTVVGGKGAVVGGKGGVPGTPPRFVLGQAPQLGSPGGKGDASLLGKGTPPPAGKGFGKGLDAAMMGKGSPLGKGGLGKGGRGPAQ